MLPALQNNNPGNIVSSNISWQGQTGNNNGYVVFESPMWGFRALYKEIYNNLYSDNGDNNLRAFFAHYLDYPNSHSAKDVTDYANYVANNLGVGIDDEIVPNEEILKNIAHSIAQYESGNDANNWSETDYDNGYNLFLGEDIATSPFTWFVLAGIGFGFWYLFKK